MKRTLISDEDMEYGWQGDTDIRDGYSLGMQTGHRLGMDIDYECKEYWSVTASDKNTG